MASYKRILDNALAWEYLQAGLLHCSWTCNGTSPVPRKPDRWMDRDEWMRMRFDGLTCMCNYILVED